MADWFFAATLCRVWLRDESGDVLDCRDPTQRSRWFAAVPLRNDMARWPDERKANLIAIALVFALFPLLCWLCWWWIKSA